MNITNSMMKSYNKLFDIFNDIDNIIYYLIIFGQLIVDLMIIALLLSSINLINRCKLLCKKADKKDKYNVFKETITIFMIYYLELLIIFGISIFVFYIESITLKSAILMLIMVYSIFSLLKRDDYLYAIYDIAEKYKINIDE